jgi:predicted DNA-binding transcriptional regulator AlpA
LLLTGALLSRGTTAQAAISLLTFDPHWNVEQDAKDSSQHRRLPNQRASRQLQLAQWVNPRSLIAGGPDMRALSTRPRHITVSNDSRYLSAAQIMERFGVSHMWLIRRMSDSNFPRPIKFTDSRTGRRFWRIADVDEWERQRIKQNSGS